MQESKTPALHNPTKMTCLDQIHPQIFLHRKKPERYDLFLKKQIYVIDLQWGELLVGALEVEQQTSE